MLSFKQLTTILLALVLGSSSLIAKKVGGTNWAEAKEALMQVYYSYTYLSKKKAHIKAKVDKEYSFVKVIMHETQADRIAALILGKGNHLNIIFGGATEYDKKIYAQKFLGRQAPWGGKELSMAKFTGAFSNIFIIFGFQ